LPDFSALESPLYAALDAGIYVEPKDRDPASEDKRQAAFVRLMRTTARGCRVAAVPNGTNITTRYGRAKVQREGMAGGEPDLQISWAGGFTARIEFKSGSGKPDDRQVEVLNWYHVRGHPVAVCRTAEGALRWLRFIGAPVPEVKS
jgi:hypothetical protein